ISKMNDVNLTDLLVSYPSVDTPQLQTLVTAKREFNLLASSPNEPLPPKGQFLKHQQLTLRYMRAYDQLMIISETGTGKTGEIDIVTEYFKHQHFHFLRGRAMLDKNPNLLDKNTTLLDKYKPNLLDKPYKRAIVLVKGESLIKE